MGVRRTMNTSNSNRKAINVNFNTTNLYLVRLLGCDRTDFEISFELFLYNITLYKFVFSFLNFTSIHDDN